MDDQIYVEPEETGSTQAEGFAENISGENVQFGPGFALRVEAQNAHVERAGVMLLNAGGDVQTSYCGGLLTNVGGSMVMSNGGAFMVNIGGNAEINNGGAWVMNIAKNAEITNGGALVAVGQQTTVEHSTIGVLISSQAELGEGSRVLLNTPQAIAAGAALGVVFALLRWLFRK